MLRLHAHGAEEQQNGTDMNRTNGHGGMLTVCFIHAIFTAGGHGYNANNVVYNRSQRRSSVKTADIPCCLRDMP